MLSGVLKLSQRTVQGQYRDHATRPSWSAPRQTFENANQHHLDVSTVPFTSNQSVERVWQYFKLGLRWQLPKNLNELQLLMRARLEAMPQTVIASVNEQKIWRNSQISGANL
ncbi:hypothetical protein [Leptolyngbya sp. FACHB-321]|uniref:hypothetical protein n=1 Tax=Leptolyngbya sp. FACHB-321 TaxID=2692807 RepID=UPI0018EFFB25|nr:hypothetical protein [Leptolyngbya sp. FACHB-321]